MDPTVDRIKTDVGHLHKRVEGLENDCADTKSSIASLQKSNEYIDVFIEKMDVAIDKLHEISNTMSQIVVQQGARLDSQEKLIDRIIDTIEVRRSETEAKLSTVHSNVMLEVSNVRNIVEKELKSVQELVNKVDEKVNKVEKWMWSMTGAIGVVVFVAEIISKFV